MDKYEFNIKVEQMKKLVSRKDYETASKIADSIDWRRVRSANLLTTVSGIYEEIGEYQEAIDILLIAFERTPGGKFLLYKLTLLAIKSRNLSEAEAYFNEFCDIAGEDSRKDLLKYLIMKEKGISVDKLILALETYVKEELDEKWLYELAELYHQAGLKDKCVELCDKIILMFGIGVFVDKAMELKQQYEPLTKYQKDLIENKEKYEEKLRAVEREFGSTSPVKKSGEVSSSSLDINEEVQAILYQNEQEPELAENKNESEIIQSEENQITEAIVTQQDYYHGEAEVNSNSESVNDIDKERYYDEELVQLSEVKQDTIKEDIVENQVVERQDVSEQNRESEDTDENGKTEEINTEPARQIQEMHQIKAVTPMAAEALKRNIKEDPGYLEHQQKKYDYTMVEAEEAELGLKFAIQTLKNIHKKNDVKKPVIKITGERINKKGFLQSRQQLMGKDLIIENAGDMTLSNLNDLKNWMLDVDTDSTVILVDNPRQVYRMKEDYQVVKYLFKQIEATMDELFEEKPKDHLGVFINDKEDMKVSIKGKKELDWQEFEEYACKYANEIDCFIPEKSLTALQERIEMLEEEGIPLTKENAEELIENAADKAEKPSIGRAITGAFAPKYNKDGLLILREKHFLD